MQIYSGLRQSIYSLWRNKSFLLTVVLTMGIASGVFLFVLSIGWQVLLKPLPYPESEQLHLLHYQRLDADAKLQSSAVLHPAAEQLYLQLKRWQQPAQTSSKVVTQPSTAQAAVLQALVHLEQEIVMSDEAQPRLSTAYTTPELQQMLGMPMLLGQGFTDAQLPGSMNPGVILSYQAWQLLFQQRPDVLGQKINVNGVSHPVLGVLAASFVPPQLRSQLRPVDLWLPWDYNNAAFKGSWHLSDEHSFLVFKGESAVLKQWLTALIPLAQQQFAEQLAGEENFAGWTLQLQLQSMQQYIASGSQEFLLLLLLGAVGLLVIATTNILNLFLSRLMLMQKQLAIRAALGARRIQLGQQLFAEALLLMLLSACLALMLTQIGFIRLTHWFSTIFPLSTEFGLPAFSFVSAVLLALALALLIATLSLRTVRYHQLSLALHSSGKGAGVQIPQIFRRSFILLQLCCAIVLVFISSLVVQDAYHKLQRPLGFNSQNVLQVEFSVATLDWQGWDSYAPQVAEMAVQLRQQSGIAGVSFAYNPLVDRFQMSATELGTDRRFYPIHRNVDQHYFQVTHQLLLAGQGFSAADIRRGHSPGMIVNRTFAQQLLAESAWQNQSDQQAQTAGLQQVLGRRIQLDIEAQPFTIVGVTEDIQLPGITVTPPRFYITNLGTALWLLIKLEPGAIFSKEQMIRSLQQADSQFALTHFSVLSDQVAQLYLPKQFMLLGAISLALFTIVLCGIGLVGVMHYNLQLRRSEFSIKLALGAQYRHVVKESGREYLALLLASVLLSIVLLTSILFFGPQLPELAPPSDLLLLYLLTLVLVAGCGMVAHWLPLRQLKQTPISVGMRGSTQSL